MCFCLDQNQRLLGVYQMLRNDKVQFDSVSVSEGVDVNKRGAQKLGSEDWQRRKVICGGVVTLGAAHWTTSSRAKSFASPTEHTPTQR